MKLARKGDKADLVEQLARQLNPFEFFALETLSFKTFTNDLLGVYCNLSLLDHKSGYVPDRGSLEAASDFLPDDNDFPIAEKHSCDK
ncbi:MAG: hypothetical protein KDI83_00245 [Gammaproteobacteria bacterium]|nr:hypothetical protein [Gammaproteobacteria bacterium]